MCYSALVEHDLKKLNRGFKARIDENAFMDLFTERADVAAALLDGSKEAKKIVVAKNLDWTFLKDPHGATGREIAKQIQRWWSLEEKRLGEMKQVQTLRVTTAEAALQKKVTKKAENDLRVGTNKIQKAEADLQELRREPEGESDSWIWPKYHFPGIHLVDGERLIRPYRYLIRPRGQGADFDDKYDGAYNAQQERLNEVFFWRELLGRHHGFMVVHRFRERQDEDLLKGHKLKLVGPPKTRKEFEFDPGAPITVPFIWDHWQDPEKKAPDLWSAAAITCDPSKEIQKQGIRRLLTPLKEANLKSWENASRKDVEKYLEVLADYQWEDLRIDEVA